MSKLLIQESPLTFQPSLAIAVGLNEAIVLQQIHYWLSNQKNKGYEQDGYKWVYNTYAEWKEANFPFWSENTIQRTFASLEEKGLVVSIQPMKGKYNRTKYYRIEYTKLEGFDDPKLVSSLDEPETTTENTIIDVLSTSKEYKQDHQIETHLAMSNFPGAKRQVRIDSILSYIGGRLKINVETKAWKEFAKRADNAQQEHKQGVAEFFDWLLAQKGFDLAYWPPTKMWEHWPRAFAESKSASPVTFDKNGFPESY